MKKIFIALILLSNCNADMFCADKITKLDSMVISLMDIYSLDQGIRSDVNLYLNNSKAFNLRMDSICFNKAINFIKKFGWPNDLGKYNDSYGYLLESLTAVMLHSPHRLIDKSVYELLKEEIISGRLNPELMALFLDKYYVIYEGKTLYNTDFKKFLSNPYPKLNDKQISDSLRKDLGLLPLPDSVYIN